MNLARSMSAVTFIAMIGVANAVPVDLYLPPPHSDEPARIAAPRDSEPSLQVAHPIDVYIPPPKDDENYPDMAAAPVTVYLPPDVSTPVDETAPDV